MPIAKIDSNLCNGCGTCVDTCPEDVIRLNIQPVKEELLSPCAGGCPAGISVRKYAYYVEMGMMEEAIKMLREYIPFPSVTGRVCPHTCEKECARCEVDEPVNINCLERYVGDYFLNEKATPVTPIYAQRVAVVGSGPAGLSCAYYLCKKGYSVTVFEQQPVLGGMLKFGIPDFVLPREIVDAQIEYIGDMGVEFKTGIAVGKDVSFDELQKQYGAVFVATGNQLSRKTKVDGDEAEGIVGALELLRAVGLGEKVHIGKQVAVIGGGNVAVDAALTAKQLGASEVKMICLESKDKMPAFEKEINCAESAGVDIIASSATQRVYSENGHVSGIDVIACVSVTNEKGVFAPEYDETIKTHIDVDQIIFAIGQAADMSLLPEEIKGNGRGFVPVDKVTLETGVKGIFAGGDIVQPQNTSVVKAAAAGRRAAESIDLYLRGKDMKAGRDIHTRVQYPPKDGILPFPRQEVENDAVGFSENSARVEAMRCMTCGSRAEIVYPEDCMVCLYCERDCPTHAIYVSPDRMARRIAPWDLS